MINSDANKKANPEHYTGPLARFGLEPIDIIAECNMNFQEGCIFKYILRKDHTNKDTQIEHLIKIKEYAEFEILRLQGLPVSRTRREKFKPLAAPVLTENLEN